MAEGSQEAAGLFEKHFFASMQRQNDGANALAEFTRLGHIKDMSQITYVGAMAARHVEESGSGRVRILDASNSKTS